MLITIFKIFHLVVVIGGLFYLGRPFEEVKEVKQFTVEDAFEDSLEEELTLETMEDPEGGYLM